MEPQRTGPLPLFEVCLYIGDASSWEIRTTVHAADYDEAIRLVRHKVDRLWSTTARAQFDKCRASVIQLLTDI